MNNKTKTTSLVPMGLTISLGVLAFVLAILGYAFRWLAGDDVAVILRHAVVVVSFFIIVVPSGFVGGAWLLNKFTGSAIQPRNAWTLGWLMSCVAILTIMGRYS